MHTKQRRNKAFPVRSLVALTALTTALLGVDCAGARPGASPGASPGATPSSTAPRTGTFVLSVVGTNDLHGRIASLPWFAGHVQNLRRVRANNGAVLLLDAGDMFHGTVESNLDEGATVIAAYNAIGYDAAAIGNHEFDFGPVGDQRGNTTDDPRGALLARAREARFPLLTANLSDRATRQAPRWSNVAPSLVRTIDGIRVGLVGVTTEATPRTTAARNFVGLEVRSPATALTETARSLRAQGATVVLALAHLGGHCTRMDNADDASSCRRNEEIMEVLSAVPSGLIDMVVAGHTHQGMAHRIAGVPVIESYAQGRSFGRVDLTVDRATGRVVSSTIFRPQRICGLPTSRDDAPSDNSPAPTRCEYEGAPVQADPAVQQLVRGALARAEVQRAQPLGVTIENPIRRAYREPSALGEIVARSMLAQVPDADAAITNAGGLRADLAAGPLTFGQLYEALPFDNALVLLTMRGRTLSRILVGNARGDTGIFSMAGLRARLTCNQGTLSAALFREDGRPVQDDDSLSVVTSDFLASGGDAFTAEGPPVRELDLLMRDAALAWMRAQGGTLRGDDVRWFDPNHPRIELPSARPVRCSN